MRIILQEEVTNLGNVGDKVQVKAGYARNYLIPYGKAVPATPENLKLFESRRAEFEKRAADILTKAQARAAELAKLVIDMQVEASDEGKLFGSVGPRDIAEAAVEQGIELAKSEVSLPEGPIRAIGEYDVICILHTDVHTTLKLRIAANIVAGDHQ